VTRFWVTTITFVLVQAAGSLLADAHSQKEADRWYMRGLLEKDHYKRVDYLEIALERNRELYDAGLEIGLSRNALNQYTPAEMYQKKAYALSISEFGKNARPWPNKVAEQTTAASMQLAVRTATVVAFMLSLPLLGYIAISPKIRARFFLMIHNYERAALLYEYIIFRKPESLWVYPILARIYDEWGRSDRRALAVYQMLQHLTSSEKQGAEKAFSKRIAQKYLEGDRISVESVQSNKQPPVV
jgi:tetratricopeptide (TPR) repeat protein